MTVLAQLQEAEEPVHRPHIDKQNYYYYYLPNLYSALFIYMFKGALQ